MLSPAQKTCLHCGNLLHGPGDFCCGGCQKAFEMAVELPVLQPKPAAAPAGDATDLARFVGDAPDGGHHLTMVVSGMHCANCAFLIESTLNKQPDVAARVNLTQKRLSLSWRGPAGRAADLVARVAALGYRVMPFDPSAEEDEDRAERRQLLRCLVVAGIATVGVMMFSDALWITTRAEMGGATRDFLQWMSALIALPATIYAGQPFFASAWSALKNRRTNMDVPISLAVILASLMSLAETIRHGEHTYYDSGVMLLFLLLIGRVLDRQARGRARAAAGDLLAMMAGTATTLVDGKPQLVPIRELQQGDVLWVAPGERIAADGDIETGRSTLDPSLITGETVPVAARPGQRVLGGMVNLDAALTVRISATAEGSLIGEIIRLMEKAEQGQARYVRLADRVARLYTPVVHGLAAAALLGWLAMGAGWYPALTVAVSVLIITCPCALGLAVPVVQVLASTRLFKSGMLLKSADALERLAKVDTIIFDKTGTLTVGRPVLANGGAVDGADLRLAATLAGASRHPLAKALAEAGRAAVGDALPVVETAEDPGNGLRATVDGRAVRLGRRGWCGDAAAPHDDALLEMWLDDNGRKVRFTFRDTLRQDAAAVTAELRRRGYRLVLLSGDRAQPVRETAEGLGFSEFHAAITPPEKSRFIESERQQGRNVLMVGDGLNDAPALATANVSMSPATAMDIAQNAADIVFQGAHLAPVAHALVTAKATQRLVNQNFALAILYNLIAVPVAMAGLATPLVAAVAMSASSILVVLNALRLTWTRDRGRA